MRFRRRVIEPGAGPFLFGVLNVTPDKDLAHNVVWHAVGRGLMLFAPVGLGSATIKICPPLCITEDAVVEGVTALADAFADCIGG